MSTKTAIRVVRRLTRNRYRTAPAVACLVLVVCSTYGWAAAKDELAASGGTSEMAGDAERSSEVVDQPGGIPPVVVACAACHQLPPPDILPTQRWPHMITRMKLLIEQYKIGAPLKQLEIDQILRYYVNSSPAQIDDVMPNYAPRKLKFDRQVFGKPAPAPGPGAVPPIIGNLSVVDLDRDRRPDVLVSDISGKALTWIARRESDEWKETKLATVTAPARTEVADVDADGDLDIVVSDLGTIEPTDDRVGKVIVLEGDGQMNFSPRTLAEGLARVCDVRPVDLDGDRDLDILFAAYGMYNVGQAGWLERQRDGSYRQHTIYTRNGISHVPVADLNGDERPDFVALLSQQHEQVIAFINRGGGQFDQQLLFSGPHPMYGASHLQLVDLDEDGDTDAIFTNGDALDAEPYPKPWHGVHWIENQGDLQFVHHEIERFSGAYSAAVGDMDGDDDLDIVVTSMMNRWDDLRRQSIMWLENDGDENFTPQRLSYTPTYLVTSAVGDFDGDGRLDAIAGGMYVFQPYYRVGRITLWRNLGAPE